MKPRRMAVPVLLMVASLGVWSRQARAESLGESEKLVREGLELRRLGNDDAALSKFQSAFALEPTPKHTAQLGLCEQALGRWTDAERHLSEAISTRNDAWVSKHLATLRESLEAAKANVGRLEFVGGPPGASLTVNGAAAGTLPLEQPVKANAGQVYLEVTASGFSPWSNSLLLAGGHFQRVVVKMTALGPKVTSAPLPVASDQPQANGSLPAISASPEVEPSSNSTRSLFSTWWFWTGAGVLVTGAIVTAVLVSPGTGSASSCPQGVDACSLQGK